MEYSRYSLYNSHLVYELLHPTDTVSFLGDPSIITNYHIKSSRSLILPGIVSDSRDEGEGEAEDDLDSQSHGGYQVSTKVLC